MSAREWPIMMDGNKERGRGGKKREEREFLENNTTVACNWGKRDIRQELYSKFLTITCNFYSWWISIIINIQEYSRVFAEIFLASETINKNIVRTYIYREVPYFRTEIYLENFLLPRENFSAVVMRFSNLLLVLLLIS